MLRTRGSTRWLPCALVVLATPLSLAMTSRSFGYNQAEPIPTPQEATDVTPPVDANDAAAKTLTDAASAAISEASAPADAAAASTDEQTQSAPTGDDALTLPPDDTALDQPTEFLPQGEQWEWQWAPVGLIYHSYMAGPHEPRMALVPFSNLDDRTLADATLGGRVGFLRYGNNDGANPTGYQLDFYGAAIARLDLAEQQDLDATDYVFGFPITWGDAKQQWKVGYAHLSSHVGDEYGIKHPGALFNRFNYVRDSIVLGTSYYVDPRWRLYGEVGWAFHADGGAETFDTQFGTEWTQQAGPTDGFVPFVAVNAHVLQDNDYTTNFTAQAGWLKRNILGQEFRFGGQYYHGTVNQFSFFGEKEQQVGVGLWYDF